MGNNAHGHFLTSCKTALLCGDERCRNSRLSFFAPRMLEIAFPRLLPPFFTQGLRDSCSQHPRMSPQAFTSALPSAGFVLVEIAIFHFPLQPRSVGLKSWTPPSLAQLCPWGFALPHTVGRMDGDCRTAFYVKPSSQKLSCESISHLLVSASQVFIFAFPALSLARFADSSNQTWRTHCSWCQEGLGNSSARAWATLAQSLLPS